MQQDAPSLVYQLRQMEITYQPAPARILYNGHITRRELQILSLLAEGSMSKEIATSLNISIGTVKQHLKNIYQKTGAHNKIEALNKTKWLTASRQATNTYC